MNSQVKKLTFTALMAAMITIFTAYICHIPVGQNGGYIHFGDSLIYIAACLHRSHRNNSGFCSGKLYTKRWKCYNICYSWTGT